MIGKVSGTVDSRGADHVLVDVGGVGYVVHCSDRTLAALPEAGGAVALYTDLVVREDLLQLVGFSSIAEREVHRLLTSVQGVGAKAGLAILGTLGAEGVARALSLGDATAIRAAPGIGPKLAQRVVLELKAKAAQVLALVGAAPAATLAAPPRTARGRAAAAPAAPTAAASTGEALSALVNLGYGEGEAAAAVAAVADDGQDTAAIIRAALRALAPKQ